MCQFLTILVMLTSFLDNIGSIPAVIFSGPVNDYFGRRMGMFAGAVIIIIGTVVQAPSVNRGMFLAGRFILGFGVSFCCVSAPCYVSEMAHPQWRGTLTGLYNCTWYSKYKESANFASRFSPDCFGYIAVYCSGRHSTQQYICLVRLSNS